MNNNGEKIGKNIKKSSSASGIKFGHWIFSLKSPMLVQVDVIIVPFKCEYGLPRTLCNQAINEMIIE